MVARVVQAACTPAATRRGCIPSEANRCSCMCLNELNKQTGPAGSQCSLSPSCPICLVLSPGHLHGHQEDLEEPLHGAVVGFPDIPRAPGRRQGFHQGGAGILPQGDCGVVLRDLGWGQGAGQLRKLCLPVGGEGGSSGAGTSCGRLES